jgi:UDP-glucose 4-epimerase
MSKRAGRPSTRGVLCKPPVHPNRAGQSDTFRVLVTEAAVFIGSHLVRRPVGEGYRSDTVLDDLSRRRTANLAATWKYISFLEADIRSRRAVASRMGNINVVFRLAAQSNVLGAIEVNGRHRDDALREPPALIAGAEREGRPSLEAAEV